MAAAAGVYLWGALSSELLNADSAARNAYVKKIIETRSPDYTRELELAEAYWRTYPNVAKDKYYGRNGQMGVHGARAHFEAHGKRIGWKWPGAK